MTLPAPADEEQELLRSVAIQNAQSILLARQRAEQELVAAKEALEMRTAELERAHELIRTIAENAASSLLMLGPDGVATYMNPAAIEETGYTLEEFSKAPFHQILHQETIRAGHPAARCPINIAWERGIAVKKQRDFFVRKDGSTFPASCSLSPLQRNGQAAGAVLEFRDITEELLAQKGLEDANRRKDQFLATLSHELRTPMTAVLGWARMLKMGLSDEDARQAVDAIEKSASMQAKLIEDVLDVSRILAGKMTFIPVPVEVPPVLQAAMTTIHPAAAAKGIEILASVAPLVPRILGDEGRLQQIIWNLLSNAVKFTQRGGTITVRLSHVGSILRLTVHDSGKGIEPAYLPQVFEPFTQEDGSTTRAHEGVGLGLSIVRSLVELHGGRIHALSEGVGKGATFTVELPAIEEPHRASANAQPLTAHAAAAPSPLTKLQGVRILVIDDQEFTRDVVAAILRHAEADVQLARSVQEGLEHFHTLAPHVVVCDVAMPGEDGFSFVRTIRSLTGPSKETPVIALTAFGRPEDERRALSAGFDAYLKKPVDPETLASTILQFHRRD